MIRAWTDRPVHRIFFGENFFAMSRKFFLFFFRGFLAACMRNGFRFVHSAGGKEGNGLHHRTDMNEERQIDLREQDNHDDEIHDDVFLLHALSIVRHSAEMVKREKILAEKKGEG